MILIIMRLLLAATPAEGTIVVAIQLTSGRHGHCMREHHDTVLVIRLLGSMKLALAASRKVLRAIGGGNT